MILYVIFYVLLFITGGILIIIISMPPLFPVEKGNIKDSDYQIMSRIFSHELPKSFKIRHKTLVGPWMDGPGHSIYECRVSKSDFYALINESKNNLELSDLCFSYGGDKDFHGSFSDQQINSKSPITIYSVSLSVANPTRAYINVKYISQNRVDLTINPGYPPENWLH